MTTRKDGDWSYIPKEIVGKCSHCKRLIPARDLYCKWCVLGEHHMCDRYSTAYTDDRVCACEVNHEVILTAK